MKVKRMNISSSRVRLEILFTFFFQIVELGPLRDGLCSYLLCVCVCVSVISIDRVIFEWKIV